MCFTSSLWDIELNNSVLHLNSNRMKSETFWRDGEQCSFSPHDAPSTRPPLFGLPLLHMSSLNPSVWSGSAFWTSGGSWGEEEEDRPRGDPKGAVFCFFSNPYLLLTPKLAPVFMPCVKYLKFGSDFRLGEQTVQTKIQQSNKLAEKIRYMWF